MRLATEVLIIFPVFQVFLDFLTSPQLEIHKTLSSCPHELGNLTTNTHLNFSMVFKHCSCLYTNAERIEDPVTCIRDQPLRSFQTEYPTSTFFHWGHQPLLIDDFNPSQKYTCHCGSSSLSHILKNQKQ